VCLGFGFGGFFGIYGALLHIMNHAFNKSLLFFCSGHLLHQFQTKEIKKIKDTGKINFDVAVTTPDMMPKLASVAKILGPKGLMPNPKTETVGPNVKQMISELKKGKVTFKNDDTGNVHQIIGRISFSDEKLHENLTVFLETLKKAKPSGSKGTYIKNLVLCSTMGPAIKINI